MPFQGQRFRTVLGATFSSRSRGNVFRSFQDNIHSNPSSHPSRHPASNGLAPLRCACTPEVASKQASKQASKKQERKEKKDKTENMEKKKYTQKEPNDLFQFCKKSQTFNKFASKWHQKRHQIIELRLKGFPLRLEAFKGRKSKPERLQKTAKRMPKRSHGPIGWPKG